MNIISFSPDETKILYEASISGTIPQIIKPSLIGTNPTKEDRNLLPKHLYVYDIKEDKNYPISFIADTKTNQKIPRSLSEAKSEVGHWLPTSLHLVVATPKGIDIMEYDGGNRATVYAGPFLDGFVTPGPPA